MIRLNRLRTLIAVKRATDEGQYYKVPKGTGGLRDWLLKNGLVVHERGPENLAYYRSLQITDKGRQDLGKAVKEYTLRHNRSLSK